MPQPDPRSRIGVLTLNEKRDLRWLPDGGSVPDGWKVESLLATEDRIEGTGTNGRRWHLVVLKR